jgi:hypothetical protein
MTNFDEKIVGKVSSEYTSSYVDAEGPTEARATENDVEAGANEKTTYGDTKEAMEEQRVTDGPTRYT